MKPQVPEGALVFVSHLRKFEGAETLLTRHAARRMGIDAPPDPKGGITLVQIELQDGGVLRGAASCNPKDTYNKAIGRMIATGRALKGVLAP